MRKKSIETGDIFLDDFLDKIFNIFQEDVFDYDALYRDNNEKYYLYALCPICNYPTIAKNDKIICSNGCYMFDFETQFINKNYTLEQFLEHYNNYYLNHMSPDCYVFPLFFDFMTKRALFACRKCNKNIFK